MKFPKHTISQPRSAFTLVELLTVIAIIAVLMGLLFPTVGAVKESARKAQAKNDVTQLVTAVKAYYTEYGKYPIASPTSDEDFTYDSGNPNQALMAILMGANDTMNPRKIVFFEPPVAKQPGRYGIEINSSGAPTSDFLDPWGGAYKIRIDVNYNNRVRELGSGKLLTTGVIAWSAGKDKTDGSSKTSPEYKDNVLSWE